jgi:hypothetical protein
MPIFIFQPLQLRINNSAVLAAGYIFSTAEIPSLLRRGFRYPIYTNDSTQHDQINRLV